MCFTEQLYTSVKTNNEKSLNGISCIGPTLQNDLIAVILNWRLYKFVFIADIQKMYRCIDMNTDDAQYQRILWRDKNGIIQEYCLPTVTFGTAPAPYLAIRVMHQLAGDGRERHPLAHNILKNEMYVDDVQSGSYSIDRALQKQEQLITALKSGGRMLELFYIGSGETSTDGNHWSQIE